MRDGVELPRDLRGARGIDVENADQIDVGQPAQQSSVVVAEGAGADDPDAHPRCRHTMTPRWDASMNASSRSTSGTGGSSARARAMPWLTVRSELNSRR